MDLDEALAMTRARHPNGLSEAAKKELLRRRNLAQNMARQALTNLHRDEYKAFYDQALAKVDAERGPLPE